jgi:hypothetical protein
VSVAVILQALGWVSVVGLVTVHLLIQRGRLRSDGPAYRIAGCAAAACVVAASAAEQLWPVAVLGLLWLRIEVFGHRNHVPECPAEPSAPAPEPEPESAPVPERMPWLLMDALQRPKAAPSKVPPPKARRQTLPVPARPPQPRPPEAHRPVQHPPAHLPHAHLPHPHLPHPHLGRRTVDRVFKIEMGIVIVIALVLFGIWAEQQRERFTTTTDYVVCNWIEGC